MKDNAWIQDGLNILDRVVSHLRAELGDSSLAIKAVTIGDVGSYTLLRGESRGKLVVAATSMDKMGNPIGADVFFRSEEPLEQSASVPGVKLPSVEGMQPAPLPPPPPLGVTFQQPTQWVDKEWEEVLATFSGLQVAVTNTENKSRLLVVTKDNVYNVIS